MEGRYKVGLFQNLAVQEKALVLCNVNKLVLKIHQKTKKKKQKSWFWRKQRQWLDCQLVKKKSTVMLRWRPQITRRGKQSVSTYGDVGNDFYHFSSLISIARKQKG